MTAEGVLAVMPLYIPIFAVAGFVSGLVVLFILCQFIDVEKLNFNKILWGFTIFGALFGIFLNIVAFTHVRELREVIQEERNRPIIVYSEEEHQPPEGGNTHANQEAVQQ